MSEASAYTGSISCGSLSISDLTGIEAFTALTDLRCPSNSLTSLDLTQNTELTYLVCYDNNLETIDVSKNTVLGGFSCHTNLITALDVSKNTSLTFLCCSNNILTKLDVSKNTALNNLICHTNSLNQLNMANGNNINFTQFPADNNPDLLCIQVDDANWSTTNWSNKVDSIASFSEDCKYNVGIKKEESTISLSIYPNPAQTQITIVCEEKN